MADFVKKIKEKLLWSSVLRSFMQCYFLQTYTNLDRLDKLIDHTYIVEGRLVYVVMTLTILIMIAFPIFTTIFLIKKKDVLLEEYNIRRFGTLYSNLRTFHRSNINNLYWVTLYLAKRFLVTLITVWVK